MHCQLASTLGAGRGGARARTDRFHLGLQQVARGANDAGNGVGGRVEPFAAGGAQVMGQAVLVNLCEGRVVEDDDGGVEVHGRVVGAGRVVARDRHFAGQNGKDVDELAVERAVAAPVGAVVDVCGVVLGGGPVDVL
jgi:hypothetical protein